jgi:hypothetical protein
VTPNKERIQLWVEALESGEYAQTVGSLHETETQVGGKWRPQRDCPSYDGPVREAYCCLGVAAEVALSHGFNPAGVDWNIPCMTPELAEWYGLEGDPLIFSGGRKRLKRIGEDEPLTAVQANDQKGWSFTEIAAAVKETYLQDEDVAE